MRKSLQMQLIEEREGRDIRDLLLEELNAGRTYRQIAQRWDLHEMTIQRWVDHLRLQRRWQRETVAA